MSIQITTLDNGLRIATDTMPDAESVVVGAWVGIGTRHEPMNANGVAHLVEHMMFKGTKTRSAYALSAAIENKGGSMNAHTTREETAYYARVLPEDTELGIDIIADMLRRSVYDAKELEREKSVIIQEIGRDLDTPEDYVFDLMHKIAYPKQKMGRPILGTSDVIARLPRSVVVDYVARYYEACNMIVVASGKIEHDDFVAMAKKRFRSLKPGRKPVINKARVSGGIDLMSKEIEQLHLVIGFSGPSLHERAVYPTQLLSLLLGGSSASRLFQKVREKRGLVYSVSSGHAAFSDSGVFQIYAGTDPARVKELIPVVCDELLDVARHVTRGELDRAKSQMRAELLMGKESVMRRAEMLGHQVLTYNRTIPAEEILRHVMKVEQEDIQAIAGKIFSKPPIVTALGPISAPDIFESIVTRLAG